MEILITFVRPYLEVLYFISGIALAVGLGLTYKQLSLLKADMQNRSERAAAERAIESADMYLCEYVPLSGTYFEAKKANKLKSYGGPIGDFSFQSLPRELLIDCNKRYALTSWLPALNRLESIAARFTSGVADESVGFKIVGRTYCGTVESNYDLIAISRQQEPFGYWSNIVELYSTWRPRLTKAELDLARQDIDEKLSKLLAPTIPPI